jgi:hypothetical protein
MNKDERRKKAIEITAKSYQQQIQKLGGQISYEAAKERVREVAIKSDNKSNR